VPPHVWPKSIIGMFCTISRPLSPLQAVSPTHGHPKYWIIPSKVGERIWGNDCTRCSKRATSAPAKLLGGCQTCVDVRHGLSGGLSSCQVTRVAVRTYPPLCFALAQGFLWANHRPATPAGHPQQRQGPAARVLAGCPRHGVCTCARGSRTPSWTRGAAHPSAAAASWARYARPVSMTSNEPNAHI